MKNPLTCLAFLGLSSIPWAQVGDPLVIGELEVTEGVAGFTGVLLNGDAFGQALANLGDLNGDGFVDLAVGASAADLSAPTGAVWILFGDGAGGFSGQVEITPGSAGFVGPLDLGDGFGSSLALLGDLNGDGNVSLAVGAPGEDDGGGGGTFEEVGAFWILDLQSDGTVVGETKWSATTGNLPFVLPDANFGAAMATLGDLDLDGSVELAVGGPHTDAPGPATGTVWILSIEPDQTISDFVAIAEGSGGFTADLNDLDGFGKGLAALGDLDGDGVGDLAAGATGDDESGLDEGAVWILFLEPDGTVKSHAKIGEGQGGFTQNLIGTGMFGGALAPCADLDGDGVQELLVGWPGAGGGGVRRGEMFVLFLQTDGTVQSFVRVGPFQGGFTGPLEDLEFFSTALLGDVDLDGDGVVELLVGAPEYGGGEGGFWRLTVDAVATPAGVRVQNGSHVNPLCLTSDTLPELGASWDATVDGNTQPGTTLTAIVQVDLGLAPAPTAFGELLIALRPLGGTQIATTVAPVGGGGLASHSSAVPNDASLLGFELVAQAVLLGAGPRLCNALELTLGN